MGTTIRGAGTVDEWTTIGELVRAHMDAGVVMRRPITEGSERIHLSVAENKAARAHPKSLSKVLLLNAFTHGRQRAMIGATEEERYKIAARQDYQFGLQEGRDPRPHNVADFVKNMERWLRDSARLRRLHQQSVDEDTPWPVTVFSRRQNPYEDGHVGLFVGTRKGMPNCYSSLTYQSDWVDADFSFIQNLLDRLKPLSTLLTQVSNANSSDAQHQRDIENAKRYSLQLKELRERRDEMVREDKELHDWLMTKPTFIRDNNSTRLLRTDEGSIRSTKWSLLGRHSWEDTVKQTQQQLDFYQDRMDNHTPHHMGLVNRPQLHEEITKVMADALRYAVSYSDVEVVE